KAEDLDKASLAQLTQVQGELQVIDHEQECAAMTEGQLVNEVGRLGKDVRAKEDQFRAEGGELFLRREQIEADLAEQKANKHAAEQLLRELAAGPLPLTLTRPLLESVVDHARHEIEIQRARVLREALSKRDSQLLLKLEEEA